MKIGASTSCFYPLETEKSLVKITELGFEKAEVFFNAPSELEENFVKKLKLIAEPSCTKIISVHPFSSFMETNCIFTEYKRRFEDYIGIYEKTCHAAAMLGAKYVVIHGALEGAKIPIPDERYFERFKMLVEIGKREGVMVCQENVNRFKSQTIDFCKKMRRELDGDFHMVFDIKQTIRANQNTFEFLEEFKNEIVHVHLSDNGQLGDCLPAGRGSFDFNRMKNILDSASFKGDAVIEIYSKNYDVEKELKESKAYLEKLWQI
ncbi:MAG: sugar phosphate isomerase/epimerase [Acetobacter sp.]|nr:sugar phosphate isomerase/epimerase [Bacteroides sp.]MCM1341921.1 sugar phosphate isomerase/epimerase [Acetobacter sp.]MCM1434105.1 sugar phosphate isomerase/epimerase [Clostridiales bacterium]